MGKKHHSAADKFSSPACRRDCLNLLCGLPVRLRNQQELIRAGLATGSPTYSYQRLGGKGCLVNPATLTAAGRIIALRAMIDAPAGALTSDVVDYLHRQRRAEVDAIVSASEASP